jgi:hypothetical protein
LREELARFDGSAAMTMTMTEIVGDRAVTFTSDRRSLEKHLAKQLALPAPMPICSPAKPDCSHGTVTCPVCGDLGEGYRIEDLDVEAFAAMVREVRDVVAQAMTPRPDSHSPKVAGGPASK